MRRAEIRDGLKQGLLVGAAILVVVLPPARPTSVAAPAPTPAAARAAVLAAEPDFGDEFPSAEAWRVARWALASGDAGGGPFAILDKRGARLYVFEPGGRLAGATPVLLGYAAGDHTVPGIGDRPIEQVRPDERTTPAGRFVAEPGRNALGETVVWIDYDAAVSMHRVRLTNPAERRAERLASPGVEDNRISFGCVNLPPAFFEQVVWPAFGSRRAVVYVLPEVWPLEQAFPALRSAAAG